jgi:hypothetical protein
LGTALIGVWSLIVSPIASSLSSDRQRLSFSQLRLQRYREIIKSEPSLRARLARLKAADSGPARFFQGSDTTLLSTELQQSVQGIIAAAGTEVGSSQSVAVRQEEGFFRLGLQLTLTTSAAGLYRVLYGLETASPMLFIDRLTVTVPESGVPYSTVSDGQPGLNVALELAAYAQSSPRRVQ